MFNKLEYIHTDGEVWTTQKLIDLGFRKRGWAQRMIKQLNSGEINFETVMKRATSKNRVSRWVFIGRPTEKYPTGREYTPNSVMNALRRKGIFITQSAAIQRIKRAIKDPNEEFNILQPKNQKIVPQYIPERHTPKQQKNLSDMQKVYNGEISFNKWLYGK